MKAYQESILHGQRIIEFKQRFLTDEQFNYLVDCWKMTRVGTTRWSKDRHTRMINTLDIYRKSKPQWAETYNGAYKDLSDWIEFNRNFGGTNV